MGAEHLSLRFLLLSIEASDYVKPVIELKNLPPASVPDGPFDLKVIYEDKEALHKLGALRTNDIVMPKLAKDMN